MLDRRALIALAFASVSLAFSCATQSGHADDRYYRDDPYYGNPNPVPYGYGHGHGQGYESPLERHQEHEQGALEKEQQGRIETCATNRETSART